MDKTWTVISLGTLFAWMAAMPPEVKTMQFLIQVLFVADLITGVVRSCLQGKLSSRRMSLGLLFKLTLYFGVGIMGMAVSILWKTWSVLHIVYMGIMGAEVISILGNLTVSAKRLNLDIPYPLQRVIEVLTYAFEDAREHEGEHKIFSETTVIPSDNKEPIIKITDLTSIEKPKGTSRK